MNGNCEELHNFSVSLSNIIHIEQAAAAATKTPELPQLTGLTSPFSLFAYLLVHGLWQTTELEHPWIGTHEQKNTCENGDIKSID